MRNLVLVRIDDRLIHGQLVISWIGHTNGNRILIADDDLSGDCFVRRVLKAASPPGIAVDVLSAAAASVMLKEDSPSGERIILLARLPRVFEELFLGGVEFKEIVIGGMGFTPARKRYGKSLFASGDEVACMKRLMKKGINMTLQMIPETGAVKGEKLLDLFDKD